MKDDVEFISRLEEIMPAEELDFDPTPSFGPWRHFFPREARKHPAKANLHLLNYLIKVWTRPGDVVLDPMAGTYSTCVIAALAGRIGIGVDIEEKFYKWGLEAKRLVESAPTVTPKGRMIVLRGDARRLTELLSQAAAGDIATIITSPPYLKSADRGAGINKQRERDVKIGCSTIGRIVTHPEAIDNVGDYGMIDVVITSPPYSSSAIQDYGTSNKALLEFEKIVRESFRTKGYFEYNGRRYTEEEWRRINKGELKPRGMPELWAAIIRQREVIRYNDGNPDNIANLPHGSIDVVITSLPYERALHDSVERRKTWQNTCDQAKADKGVPVGYSENPQNIGNLYSSDGEYRALEGGLMIRNDKPTYLSEMLKVYREMYKVLRPHGLAIVIVKPFYRRRKVIDLPYHSFLLMRAVGFGLEKLYKLRLKNQSFWRILLYKKYPDLPRLNHEYVLVMRRNA